MRLLKICLGLIIIILGVIVFNKYKDNDLSLEKESYMDTVFVDDKPIELTFAEYNLENNVTEISGKISSKQVGNEYKGFRIYRDNANVYGVDVNRKLKLFNIESTSVINEQCKVEPFTNVLGYAGVKFTVVDDRGPRTLYFNDNTAENKIVLFADELNATEMYLGNEYLSIVTEDKNGLVYSIITKDITGLVKKAVIDNKENDIMLFELKADLEEDTFMLSKVNKHGYTQISPYIYKEFGLQPSFMKVSDENEIEVEVDVEVEVQDNQETSDKTLKTVYPLYDRDDYMYNTYVTDDGVVVESELNTVSIDPENLKVNTGVTVVQLDGSETLKVDESYNIAKRVNSNFPKVTDYVDEKYIDGFTYVYYKINDDYYAVKNVEHNNYCFINADGAEVTGFKFYNEPKAFGEYVFVQDDKEAYFLNGKLEKVSYLPSLKGYYTLKSYEDGFVTSSTTSGKIFVTDADGKLIYETSGGYEYKTYKYNQSDDSVVEGSEIVYTISSEVYNANYNYNSEYTKVTGLENIVAEEEINHVLKKYSVNAVDEYKKNTDDESKLLNNYFVAQEVGIENKLLEIKQIETLKNKDGIVSTKDTYYYFDMDTGKEIFIKDIFKKGYEVRVLEELNFIVNDENTNLKMNIDKIGEFKLDQYLYVTYDKGELNSDEISYSIELPLENLTDVIDFNSNTFKAFSTNSKAFSGFVPTQTRSLMFLKRTDDTKNSYISVGVKFPQYISNGTDSYSKINEYYKKLYEKEKEMLKSDIAKVLEDTNTDIDSYYLSDMLLQNKIENGYMGANYNPYYINHLWNLESAEKLDLYNLFDLETEETEEFLDEIIYSKAKAFYDSKDYDESTGRRYGLLDIYNGYTNDKGERKTEVGTRAIDSIEFGNDWYLTNDGLVLVFQEYVLGGNGSQYKLLIPFEELSENLTDEIKEELKVETKK